MNSRFYWLILILILGSIAMGACTAPPTPVPTATATLAPKPTATALGGIPAGVYKPDHLLYTQAIILTGRGTFEFEVGSADPGTYVVTGDQIVFNRDDGVCHNHPGTYHWEMHGNTLTLKPIDDTCTESARSEDLGGRSWILQP